MELNFNTSSKTLLKSRPIFSMPKWTGFSLNQDWIDILSISKFNLNNCELKYCDKCMGQTVYLKSRRVPLPDNSRRTTFWSPHPVFSLNFHTSHYMRRIFSVPFRDQNCSKTEKNKSVVKMRFETLFAMF